MAREYTPHRFLYKAAKQSKEELSKIRRNHLSSFILIVLYAVGIFSLIFEVHPQFIYLTPLNLVISFIIVLLSHPKWDLRIASVLLICFLTGMGVEIWGVATGDVFGEYAYGEVLGPKLMGTPYTIGWNWMMLVYCVGTTVQQITDWELSPLLNSFVKSILGALLLTSLDILIEPVAIIQGFWSWSADGSIPIQNYIAWFLISFLLLMVYNLVLPQIKNKPAKTLLILQFIFFFLLGIEWS